MMERIVLILQDVLSQVLRIIIVVYGVRSRFRPLRWLGEQAATRMGLFLDAPNHSLGEIAAMAGVEQEFPH